MKIYQRLKRQKGFTLVECIVAIFIFAIMAAIVSMILTLAIDAHGTNTAVEKDIDNQVENIVKDESLTSAGSQTIVFDFQKGDGVTSGANAGNVTVSDAVIQKDNNTSNDDDRLEINKITATITPESTTSEGGGGGMITDDTHLYGTKGLKFIQVKATSTLNPSTDVYTVKFEFVIDDTDLVLNHKGTSLKFVLPEGTLNAVINKNDNTLNYSLLSNKTIRLTKASITSTTKQYKPIITINISKDDYDANYGTLAKYFVSPTSTSTVDVWPLQENPTAPGIYNI